MNQSEIFFQPPLYEFIADALAREAHQEIKRMARAARREIDQRFDEIAKTYNRSIAQRRRFWRLRTTLEEKKA